MEKGKITAIAAADLAHIETLVTPEKSVHRVCPSCKKGELINLLAFDGRGSPKNYQKTIKRKLLKLKP